MNLDLLLWVSLVFLIVSLLAVRSKRQSQPYPWLYIVFFFSGFSALTYQIVWQRALFAIYGVNIESVTIVVLSRPTSWRIWRMASRANHLTMTLWRSVVRIRAAQPGTTLPSPAGGSVRRLR